MANHQSTAEKIKKKPCVKVDNSYCWDREKLPFFILMLPPFLYVPSHDKSLHLASAQRIGKCQDTQQLHRSPERVSLGLVSQKRPTDWWQEYIQCLKSITLRAQVTSLFQKKNLTVKFSSTTHFYLKYVYLRYCTCFDELVSTFGKGNTLKISK